MIDKKKATEIACKNILSDSQIFVAFDVGDWFAFGSQHCGFTIFDPRVVPIPAGLMLVSKADGAVSEQDYFQFRKTYWKNALPIDVSEYLPKEHSALHSSWFSSISQHS